MSRFGFAILLSFAFAANLHAEIPAASQRIDALLAAHWRAAGVQGNAPADDATFLRRVYLDVIGRIPTLDEARAFLDSKDADRRAALIDKLLAHEGHAMHAFNQWADVLRAQSFERLRLHHSAYCEYLRESLRANKPFDAWVRELLSSSGDTWDAPATGYYLRDTGMPLDNMANTARIFLGTRIECAQCHDHPFDKWKQTDFYHLAAFTYGVDFKWYVRISPYREAHALLGAYTGPERSKMSVALGGGKLAVNGGTLSLPGFGFSNSVVFTGTSAIASTGNVTIVSNTANTFTSTGSATVSISMPSGGFLTIGGAMSGFTGTIAMGASGGMLRLNNTGFANRGSATTLFDLGTANATLANRNGGLVFDLGAVQGGPGTKLQGRQSGTGITESTYRIGALGTDNTFAGTILTGGDQLGVNIVKVGAGNWTLSGTSSYTGALSVQQGRVTISGSLACTGPTDVQSGASLALVSGTLNTEAVNIAAGAQVIGSGSITGDVINDGALTCGVGVLGIEGDIINNGTVRLTGGATINTPGTFTNNGILDLLTGASALPGNFLNGPNGIVIDSSTLKSLAAAKSGSTVTITIGDHTGHTYQLQRSDSLLAPSWSNVGSPAPGTTQSNGQPTPLPLTDPTANGLQRFYRVLVSP